MRGVLFLGEKRGSKRVQKEFKEGAKRVEKDYVVPVKTKNFQGFHTPHTVRRSWGLFQPAFLPSVVV